MKFRKKPVVVDAWSVKELLTGAAAHWNGLPQCIRSAYGSGDLQFFSNHIIIQTLEGEHRANYDDMVIRGVQGELYPCKPEIFAATYEAEPETAQTTD